MAQAPDFRHQGGSYVLAQEGAEVALRRLSKDGAETVGMGRVVDGVVRFSGLVDPALAHAAGVALRALRGAFAPPTVGSRPSTARCPRTKPAQGEAPLALAGVSPGARSVLAPTAEAAGPLSREEQAALDEAARELSRRRCRMVARADVMREALAKYLPEIGVAWPC